MMISRFSTYCSALLLLLLPGIAAQVSLPHSTFGGITHIKKMHFTHVRKCGGSTLDTMLQVWSYNHKTNLTSSESYRQPGPLSLSNEVFWLIVLRNPVDRVISHYWQVKPWERHPQGGAHAGCKAAAKNGFMQYMKSCFYSRNFMSRYFRASSSMEGFLRQLNNYNLVIPFDKLQQGILLLHLYNGFTVEDILYLNQKIYHNPKLELSAQEAALVEQNNAVDAMLYDAAITSWATRFEHLTTTSKFASSYNSYMTLLQEYQQNAEPYLDCFLCEATNCTLPGRRLAANTQYVAHYSQAKRGPRTRNNRPIRSSVRSGNNPVRTYPARTAPVPRNQVRLPTRDEICKEIITSKIAQHKKYFCNNNIKCKANNLLATE